MLTQLQWVCHCWIGGGGGDIGSSLLKGQSNEIFDIYLFHIYNSSGPMINRLKHLKYGFDYGELFDHEVGKFGLRLCEPPIFIIQIFSPMRAVFTHNWILSDCPFKSNRRPAKFFYSDSAM